MPIYPQAPGEGLPEFGVVLSRKAADRLLAFFKMLSQPEADLLAVLEDAFIGYAVVGA
jgi:hypothetical protein